MNKKLILNKVTIAQLTNPDRVFGGDGNATVSQTCWETCQATCDGETCEITFCPTYVAQCPTYGGQNTCPGPNPNQHCAVEGTGLVTG